MSSLDEAMEQVAAGWRTFRSMPREQVGLRAFLGAVGLAAIVLPVPGWPSGPGVIAIFGVLMLITAVIAPAGVGPSTVVGVSVVEWIMGYGWESSPSHVQTLILAVLLYLVHTTGALAASMAPTSHFEWSVVVRWSAQVGVVLAGTGVVAAAVYGMGTLRGSLGLELAGLVGVLLLLAVPVWLVRHSDR